MKLYPRDYRILTQDEQKEWNALKEKEIVPSKAGFSVFKKSLFHEYPRAVRHFLSLFPNNYLDPLELKEVSKLKNLVEKFEALLDFKTTKECGIINYVKQKQAYFIISSLLDNYQFGHHDAFLFPEFQLGNSYKVDYLIVGRSSDGYQMVLVELEAPYGNITISKGNLGSVFRGGLNQIEEWDTWIESRYYSLRETFDKYKKPGEILPEEFTSLDKTRINYAVIAGRRPDFTQETYRIKRGAEILLLHYDNLVDLARKIINKDTY